MKMASKLARAVLTTWIPRAPTILFRPSAYDLVLPFSTFILLIPRVNFPMKPRVAIHRSKRTVWTDSSLLFFFYLRGVMLLLGHRSSFLFCFPGVSPLEWDVRLFYVYKYPLARVVIPLFFLSPATLAMWGLAGWEKREEKEWRELARGKCEMRNRRKE